MQRRIKSLHDGSRMKEDWRQIYRSPDAPAPEVDDVIRGLEKCKTGQWVGIQAPVEAVELLESNADGSRIYSVRFGESVLVKDTDAQ
jgi:hypothetical protein